MSAPPYMKLYWADYFQGARHLRTAAEHGAYLLLIAALWDAGGKLPADDEALARHAFCTPEEWAAMKPTMMPFFRVVRGHLTSKRVTDELAKYADTVCKRKAAGKTGGSVTRGKRTANVQANAKHLPTKLEPELEPEREKDKPSLSDAARETQRVPESPIPESYPDAEAIAEAQARISEAGVILSAAAHARRFANHARTKDRRERNWPAAWRAWIDIEVERAPAAPATVTPPHPSDWAGPADVLEAVTRHMAPDRAVFHLAKCGWNAETRVLSAPVASAILLKQEAEGSLRQIGVSVAMERERAA